MFALVAKVNTQVRAPKFHTPKVTWLPGLDLTAGLPRGMPAQIAHLVDPHVAHPGRGGIPPQVVGGGQPAHIRELETAQPTPDAR
ncbi:hypothetical protein [Streptomyces sp. NPDC001401]|uniref:hypothetical protein n=1 Tax=Streptomyces sp. NPDC001401 TaxID=3364570 RepID=UPI0036C8F3E0